MENSIERIVKLIFATTRLMHEQKSAKACSYLHLVTLKYVRLEKPLMKEIAGLLGVTPPSATSLIGTLVKAELVKRQADAADRRSVRIVITKKGEKYLETYRRKAAETLKEHLSRLTREEQEQLSAILEKVTKNTD